MRSLLLAALMSFSGLVAAHDLNIARVQVQDAVGVTQIDITLPPQAALPSLQAMDCDVTVAETSGQLQRAVSYQLNCASPPRLVTIEGLTEGIFVRDRKAPEGRFVGSEEGLVALALTRDQPTESSLTRLGRFVWLGTGHILGGADHLAFVTLLALIASGWQLVRLVTAFTIGHSITLVLATLGWVNVPMPPTEALIALSIVLLAHQAVRQQGHEGFMIVMSFGLLHGLGFASELQRSLGNGEWLLALVGFNLGVEIGQLVYLSGFVVLYLIARRVIPGLNQALAYTIGALGCFWTIARVASF